MGEQIKQIVIFLYNETLVWKKKKKKKEVIQHKIMDESQKCYAEQNKPDPKRYIPYDPS